MSSVSNIAVGATAVVSVLIGTWAAGHSRVAAQAEAVPIVGAWTLNKDLSDTPQDRAPATPSGRRGGGRGGDSGRGGGGFGRGGRGGAGRGNPEDMRRMREALRDVMEAPERLTITQTASMILITSGDGRTTRLSPDGQTIKDESTNMERKTRWEGGKLVSDISGLGQGKITETYSVDPERHQLNVTIEMENSRVPQGAMIRRVYDVLPGSRGVTA